MENNYEKFAAIFHKRLGEPFYLLDKKENSFISCHQDHPTMFYFTKEGLFHEMSQNRCSAYLAGMLDNSFEVVSCVKEDPEIKNMLTGLCVSHENLLKYETAIIRRHNKIAVPESLYAQVANHLTKAREHLANAYSLLNPEGNIFNDNKKQEGRN